VKQRVENFLGGPEWLDTQHLKGRLGDAFELLDYYDVTATTLMEQQQNLLSLVSPHSQNVDLKLINEGFQFRERCSGTGCC